MTEPDSGAPPGDAPLDRGDEGSVPPRRRRSRGTGPQTAAARGVEAREGGEPPRAARIPSTLDPRTGLVEPVPGTWPEPEETPLDRAAAAEARAARRRAREERVARRVRPSVPDAPELSGDATAPPAPGSEAARASAPSEETPPPDGDAELTHRLAAVVEAAEVRSQEAAAVQFRRAADEAARLHAERVARARSRTPPEPEPAPDEPERDEPLRAQTPPGHAGEDTWTDRDEDWEGDDEGGWDDADDPGEPWDGDDDAEAELAAVAFTTPDHDAAGGGKRVARNTAIFSVFTGLSRIAGLIREVVASSYFGTGGPASAFTIAFNFPNLIRSLFADAALSAAFVPVFTELLEARKKKEAFALASTLLITMIAVLGVITLLFMLGAGVVMPLFRGKLTGSDVHLMVGLSRVLFPIVLLLGINGLVVGMLNAYGEFSMAAFAPLVWNGVIIAALVAIRPLFHGDAELYAYAIGVLIGTVAQLALVLPSLRRLDIRFTLRADFSDPRVKQVFILMIPITVGLGVINFDQFLNSTLGTLVSDQAPRAIDAAFRIYMLPQGMFSVAVATVLFPTLSRLAARRDLPALRATMSTGVRQIFLLLMPAAVFTAVLATPIIRLIYQHGDFDTRSTHQVSTALFWFSFSLPFAGANLLLTRTFFSLKQPWTPTKLAAGNLAVNAIISLSLYKPFGIAGLVVGTAVASFGMTLAQAYALRALLEGSLEGSATFSALFRIALGCVLLGTTSWLTWKGLDAVVGRSLPGQVISVGGAGAVGFGVYAAGVLVLQVAEAIQIETFVLRRVRARQR